MTAATDASPDLDVDVRDLEGSVVDTTTLPSEWFGGDVNVPLVHQVVTAQLANARTGSAQTKNRTRIRGGGRKPWRQKGTGRARHGSIRSPHWTGGAVAHGRHAEENHSQRINKKMKRGALRSALSDRADADAVTVVRDLVFPQPKTKHAAAALEALGHGDVRRVLVVLASGDDATIKSFRNIPTVHLLTVDQLNTYDVMRSDVVVIDEAGIGRLGAPSDSNDREPEDQS